jgi:hypothetical protein
MTPSDLEQKASALYGDRWQTPLARRIRVEVRTVRKWKAGDRSIPEWLDAFLDLLERYPDER